MGLTVTFNSRAGAVSEVEEHLEVAAPLLRIGQNYVIE
mgnify:FL=1